MGQKQQKNSQLNVSQTLSGQSKSVQYRLFLVHCNLKIAIDVVLQLKPKSKH